MSSFTDVYGKGGGGVVGGGRGSSDSSSSPEFEFWMMRNPSLPQTQLLSADELFVDGVILPLHLLCHDGPSSPITPLSDNDATPPPPNEPKPDPPMPSTSTDRSPASICSAPISSSKRWKDIFRSVSGEKKGEEKEERKRRERKVSGAGGGGGGGAAEININIWPFSRSRSAGNSTNTGNRQKSSAGAGRKVSSAPCSRSNSRGESSKHPSGSSFAAGRRWASSPGRAGLASGGIHVGRSSPVWQAKKGSKKAEQHKESGGGGKKGGVGGGGVGVRVLNLNVNTCIGYRQQMSCRGDSKDGMTGGDRSAGGLGGGHGSHFNLRAIFSKKVY